MIAEIRTFAKDAGLTVTVARAPAATACCITLFVVLASTAVAGGVSRGLLLLVAVTAARACRLIQACSSITAADGRSAGCFRSACAGVVPSIGRMHHPPSGPNVSVDANHWSRRRAHGCISGLMHSACCYLHHAAGYCITQKLTAAGRACWMKPTHSGEMCRGKPHTGGECMMRCAVCTGSSTSKGGWPAG